MASGVGSSPSQKQLLASPCPFNLKRQVTRRVQAARRAALSVPETLLERGTGDTFAVQFHNKRISTASDLCAGAEMIYKLLSGNR